MEYNIDSSCIQNSKYRWKSKLKSMLKKLTPSSTSLFLCPPAPRSKIGGHIHSSDMSIIQKFLTNQIDYNEIIIVMTQYCPTTQHLLHMQEGVNLLSLMTFNESKCAGYLNFLWNSSQTHYSDVRWCTSKWTLDYRRKKREGRGVLHLVSHFISLSNILYTKPDKKRTLLRHNIRRIFLVKWTGWRIVVTMLYMDCI